MSANRIAQSLTWLGGGEWRELGERHERSTHVIAGVVVLLGAALAWLFSILAITETTHAPAAVIVSLTLAFGVLIGAIARAIASGPTRGWPGFVGPVAVGIAVSAVVGELAAVVLFSGSIDRLLDERTARSADATPAVAQASAELDRTRTARTALDAAVEDAGRQRDEALVVARCEYNPSPACPQTHITGVPGTGPETRTATDFLADTKRQLDNAVANRDRVAPGLDSEITAREQALEQARRTATSDVDRGLGARWMAMNDYTIASPGAMLLRLVTIAFFALLILLPLILKLWRGQTSHDRFMRPSKHFGPSSNWPVPGSRLKRRQRSTASSTAAESSRRSRRRCRCNRSAWPSRRQSCPQRKHRTACRRWPKATHRSRAARATR